MLPRFYILSYCVCVLLENAGSFSNKTHRELLTLTLRASEFFIFTITDIHIRS